MSYKGMPVANGQAAGLLLESLIRVGLDRVESNSQEETKKPGVLPGRTRG
jgi:hypothetical protein